MGIFNKNNNPGAYRGTLKCPVCESQAIRYVENVTAHRLRYRCRKCGLTFQYDISGTLNHPYAAFKKAKWQQIVESSAYREK